MIENKLKESKILVIYIKSQKIKIRINSLTIKYKWAMLIEKKVKNKVREKTALRKIIQLLILRRYPF